MGLLTRKSLKDLQGPRDEEGLHLKRAMTTTDLLLFGIGAVIGAGLFSITGIAAAENAGPAIVIAFIFAAIGCAFAGLCYSELATMIPISGSAYTYAYASMGELPAWMIGWTLILEYAIGSATVAVSWSAYVVSFLHDFGIYLPINLVASPWQAVHLPDGGVGQGMFNFPALLIVTAISLLLIRGIKQSSLVNIIMVTIKVTTVLVFIAVGAFYVNTDNLVPFIPENTGEFGHFGWSGILRATGVLFFAYVGFDAISTISMEAKNPQKSLPKAILGALFVCTLLYVLFSLVMTGLVNYKELDVAAPVALAISYTPFPWLQLLIKLAILSGLTSVMLVLLLGQSRIFYVMACDGLLPKYFATLHKSYSTPWLANLILMVFVGLIASFAPISLIGHMTSIGTLCAFAMVCAGVIVLRYTHPEFPRPFRAPFFPYVPLLGMGTCLTMMVALDVESWLRLLIWLGVGLVIYFTYSRRHSKIKMKN